MEKYSQVTADSFKRQINQSRAELGSILSAIDTEQTNLENIQKLGEEARSKFNDSLARFSVRTDELFSQIASLKEEYEMYTSMVAKIKSIYADTVALINSIEIPKNDGNTLHDSVVGVLADMASKLLSQISSAESELSTLTEQNSNLRGERDVIISTVKSGVKMNASLKDANKQIHEKNKTVREGYDRLKGRLIARTGRKIRRDKKYEQQGNTH